MSRISRRPIIRASPEPSCQSEEKAQIALQLLKSTVPEFARANPNSVTNADAASLLGLRSDYGSGSKDYLSYSILGMLMRDGMLRRYSQSKRRITTTD